MKGSLRADKFKLAKIFAQNEKFVVHLKISPILNNS